MSPPLINWECCGFLSWFYMKQIASKFAPSLDQRIVLWLNSVKMEIVKKFFVLTLTETFKACLVYIIHSL